MVDPAKGTPVSGRDVIEKVLNSGVGSVKADDATINNSLDYAGHAIGAILEAEGSGYRVEQGITTHSDPGNASDGTWDTSQFDDNSVSFATAFATSPTVVESLRNAAAGNGGWYNASTTAVTLRQNWYGSSGSTGRKHSWIAIGED